MNCFYQIGDSRLQLLSELFVAMPPLSVTLSIFGFVFTLAVTADRCFVFFFVLLIMMTNEKGTEIIPIEYTFMERA